MDDNIIKEAMIYGKNNNQTTLNDYQKAINKAAGQLVLAEPGLLTKRGKTISQFQNFIIINLVVDLVGYRN